MENLISSLSWLDSPTCESFPLRVSRSDRLKVGGKLLSHELLARDHLEALHQDLMQAMHVNATPLPERGWINALDQEGLTVTQRQIGAMRLLNPVQVLTDEGVIHMAQIA